jgi:lipopolysaccharide export system protein LptA
MKTRHTRDPGYSIARKRSGVWLLCILFVVLGMQSATAQKLVEWINSDYVEYDQAAYGKVRRAIGSVRFKHEGTLLSCDSAYFYEASNRIEAYSNVHIQDSDTLNLYCDFLEYLPSTSMAMAQRNVVLVDPQVSLTTDAMTYDLKRNVATYQTGGTIVSQTNTLKSRKGTYYADEKRFVFEQDVVLNHPKFDLYTDTLHYNTNTEVATVFGPTTILSEENEIYTERGIYRTREDLASLWNNSWLQNNETKLEGDSIFYNRNISYSEAYRNVVITDTVNQVVMGGHYGEYNELTGYSLLTDSAWAMLMDARDTLTLHADTLYLTFDSLRNGKTFLGYHAVKFYREDLQGVCDSICYQFADSTITMYVEPVVWFGKTQVCSDTITLYFVMKQLQRMEIVGAAFIISDDSEGQYNQIKGKRMSAWFSDDELREMHVYGNTETLYYVRDDDEVLIGIDKATSDQLRMEFLDGDIRLIVYISQVKGTTYPENDVAEDARKLRGFLLRTAERPLSRSDIFRKQ